MVPSLSPVSNWWKTIVTASLSSAVRSSTAVLGFFLASFLTLVTPLAGFVLGEDSFNDHLFFGLGTWTPTSHTAINGPIDSHLGVPFS